MHKYKPIASIFSCIQRTMTIAMASPSPRTLQTGPVIVRRNSSSASCKLIPSACLWRALLWSSWPTITPSKRSTTSRSRRNRPVRKRLAMSILGVHMLWRASMRNTCERWAWACGVRALRLWCGLSRLFASSFSVTSSRWLRWAQPRNISLHLINIIKHALQTRVSTTINSILDLLFCIIHKLHLSCIVYALEWNMQANKYRW